MIDTKGKINIIVIIVIILVQLLIAAGLYFFVLKEKDEPVKLTTLEKTEILPQKQTSVASRNSEIRSSDTIQSLEARDYIKDFTIFDLGDLIVNPLGTESRFFIVTISFEHRQSDRRLPDELKNKVPLFRDRLIGYFSRLTVDDLRNIENRDIFKDDIMQMINSMLTEGRITNVFFEQFVIQ